MKWNPETRRYIDASGRSLSPAQVRKEIDHYIEVEQKDVDRQAKKLLLGTITLAAFFEFMRQKVTTWHSVAGTLAYGEDAGDAQNERINTKILSELTYLQGFEAEAEASFAAAEELAAKVAISPDIPAGLDSVVQERVVEALLDAAPSEAEEVIRKAVLEALADSLGAEEAATVAQAVTVDSAVAEQLIGATIPNRAGMYADSLFATFENNVKEREKDGGAVGVRRISEDDEASCEECPALATGEYVSFDEITDIGDTVCMSNCRCTFEFNYEGIEPLVIDRELTV